MWRFFTKKEIRTGILFSTLTTVFMKNFIQKLTSKKNLIIFCIGAGIGFVFSLYILVWTNGYPALAPPDLLISIIRIPVLIGVFLTTGILAPVCLISDPYTTTSWCAGLGFDGGPAQWFEFLVVHLTLAAFTGLIFLFLGKLYELVKSRLAK